MEIRVMQIGELGMIRQIDRSETIRTAYRQEGCRVVAMDVNWDDAGWVEVDRNTLRHVRHRDVWSLGDVAGTPNAKTGAAVRKQAPVVVENLLAGLEDREPTASYHGYSSCPLIVEKGRVILAEFDYEGKPTPSLPLIDTTKPRRDMWFLKRYGLPWLYWNMMLKGRF